MSTVRQDWAVGTDPTTDISLDADKAAMVVLPPVAPPHGVSSRYEHASLILTSNLPFARWGDVFGDQVVAAAMIDRSAHHADVITLKGSDYSDGPLPAGSGVLSSLGRGTRSDADVLIVTRSRLTNSSTRTDTLPQRGVTPLIEQMAVAHGCGLDTFDRDPTLVDLGIEKVVVNSASATVQLSELARTLSSRAVVRGVDFGRTQRSEHILTGGGDAPAG